MRRPLAFVFASVGLLAGCAASLPQVERTPSTAIAKPEETRIGRIAASKAAEHPGLSGFALIRQGRYAFASRIGFTRLAERTLDVQYYIWAADTTGRLLALKLHEAAERGVRVRVLVDDNNLQGRDEAVLALDAHPNIEVRVFNPFAHRDRHLFDFVSDLSRVNHRMHNKVMIVDGGLAIVGGRNIGDQYFGVDDKANFRDLDIAAAGPIVSDLSKSFDYFWNGEWSYPIAGLAGFTLDTEAAQVLLEGARAAVRDAPYPYPMEDDIATLGNSLDEMIASLTWARGLVVADDPAAIGATDDGVVAQAGVRHSETLRRELLIESAYFVPTKRALERYRALVARGVRVRVLTNSLASNDVSAAHAGYEKRRRELIKAGVEIHELRVDSSDLQREWSLASGRSQAGLHTKAMAFDGEALFVGSYNLDPRSANLNTEIGLYVESTALAAELKAFMDQGAAPANSWQVVIDEQGRLAWLATEDGVSLRESKEPSTGWFKRFSADIIKLLPVESQL